MDTHKLYRISITVNTHPSKSHAQLFAIREVPFAASSLVEGDVFVLDKGTKVWQLNTKESAGKEKFRAAEFARSLIDSQERRGAEVMVFGENLHYASFVYELTVNPLDEGGHGTGVFLAEFGENTIIRRDDPPTTAKSNKADDDSTSTSLKLFRISDSTGTPNFCAVDPPFSKSSLSSSDAFLLDNSSSARPSSAAMFVWLGAQSSLAERRLALEYAQRYLHDKFKGDENQAHGKKAVAIPIVKMQEGHESEAFLALLE